MPNRPPILKNRILAVCAQLAFASAVEAAPTGNSPELRPETAALLKRLSEAGSLRVQLHPNPYSGDPDSSPLDTVVTAAVARCVSRLADEGHPPFSQTYAGMLQGMLAADGVFVTEAARRFGLSADDLILLESCTGGYYFGPINEALRKDRILPKYRCFIDGVRAALERFPEFEGVVYRGTDLPRKVRRQHRKGKIVQYRAFTSASVGDFSKYFRDSSVKLTIHSHHARDISPVNDDEVLHLRDSPAPKGGGPARRRQAGPKGPRM